MVDGAPEDGLLQRVMIRAVIVAATMLTLASATFAQPRNEQRPETFADTATVAPGLVVEARYATAHNFVGVPIDGYEKPLCYLTRPAATAVVQVVQDLEARHFTRPLGCDVVAKVLQCLVHDRDA